MSQTTQHITMPPIPSTSCEPRLCDRAGTVHACQQSCAPASVELPVLITRSAVSGGASTAQAEVDRERGSAADEHA